MRLIIYPWIVKSLCEVYPLYAGTEGGAPARAELEKKRDGLVSYYVQQRDGLLDAAMPEEMPESHAPPAQMH